MPWIDLSGLVLDPFLAGELISIVRRQQAVDNTGFATTINTTYTARASVSPAGATSLTREEAYESSAKAIRVITKFRLRSASETLDGKMWMPDLVQWDGGYYLVRAVSDYTSFGAGFVEADCISFA